MNLAQSIKYISGAIQSDGLAFNIFWLIEYGAPRKLLSGLDFGGIMAIITQSDLIATVGQRGFWDLITQLDPQPPCLACTVVHSY
jgi:hypothetical protein